MEYDYYKLYFGTDSTGYDNPIYCDSLEQVELELNKASAYDKYLVIGHIKLLNQDDILASGRIEPNRTRYRKGR